MIRAADAAKEPLVTGRCGRVHVDELLRGVANDLNELGRDDYRTATAILYTRKALRIDPMFALRVS